MFRDYTLQTTLDRAAVALAGGAVVGAIAVVSAMVFRVYMKDGWEVVAGDISFALVVFILSLFIWAVGLTVLGAPIWFFLHKKGFRNSQAALFIGFFLLFTGSLLWNTNLLNLSRNWPIFPEGVGDPRWQNASLTPYGWLLGIQKSIIMGVSGSLVALTIWRIAYRRPPPC